MSSPGGSLASRSPSPLPPSRSLSDLGPRVHFPHDVPLARSIPLSCGGGGGGGGRRILRDASFHSEQTYHPFFRNQPQTSGLSLFAQVFRIRDTILPVVAPIVLFFGLYALAVVALARRSSWTWHLDDKLISIMNVPVGLLLALRANRGFERYWSGAQCWTQLTTALRNLARAVQNGIHTATPAERQDKRRLMRLIVGVAVATKYALRGENAWSSPELRVLLEHAHADGMNGEIDDSDDSDNDGAMDRYGSAPRRPRRGRSIGPAAAASAALASVPAVPSPLSVVSMPAPDDAFQGQGLTATPAPASPDDAVPPRYGRSHSRSPSLSPRASIVRHPQGSLHYDREAETAAQLRQRPSHARRRSLTDPPRAASDDALFASPFGSLPPPPRGPPPPSGKADAARARFPSPVPGVQPRPAAAERGESLSGSNATSLFDDEAAAAALLLPASSPARGPAADTRTDCDDASPSEREAARRQTDPAAASYPPAPRPQPRRRRGPVHVSADPYVGGLAINVPLDVIQRVAVRLKQHRLAGRLDRDDAASTTAAVSAVNHLLGKFETLLMVPMPRSFGVHMKQILFVYLCALPVWLVRTLGYSTVIVTVTVSLAFFGVDSIASEIEEPFGTEQNDLPLDYWCVKLREDIEHIMRGRLID